MGLPVPAGELVLLGPAVALKPGYVRANLVYQRSLPARRHDKEPSAAMAQQRTVVLIDDLDGSDAQHTVTFSLDGQQYEIDLSAQNSQRLHDALAPFMSNGRLANSEPSAPRRPRRPRTMAQPEPVQPERVQPEPVQPEPAQSRPRPKARPEAQVAAPPAEVPEPESTPAAGRPPVPVALFSDTTEQVASRAVAALKPQATELFSPAS
jgi:Lsr2 protein